MSRGRTTSSRNWSIVVYNYSKWYSSFISDKIPITFTARHETWENLQPQHQCAEDAKITINFSKLPKTWCYSVVFVLCTYYVTVISQPAVFWRFCHSWNTFSKLRKLCSDIRPLFVIKAIVSETLFAPRREAAVAAGATCSVMFILCTYYVLIISQLKLCSKRKNLGKFLIESKKILYLSSKCLLCICYVIIIVNEFSCKNTLRFISIIINIQ